MPDFKFSAKGTTPKGSKFKTSGTVEAADAFAASANAIEVCKAFLGFEPDTVDVRQVRTKGRIKR